ncbi:MAG: hypothetical protein ACNA78_10535, partial [Balneolaceae bacterium]
NGGIDNNRWPFETVGGSVDLYETEFRKTFFGPISSVPHDGVSTISSLNPEQNILYFGLDLTLVNGNNNVDQLLENFLITRLGFN